MTEKKDWLPFDEAKRLVREEQIPSQNAYFKWWDREQPQQIPKRPNRVYREEWKGWNDFLGNNNEFKNPVKKKYRPLQEATTWVHSLGLQGQKEWFDYTKNHSIPADIPHRPDLVYDDWVSWKHFLGYDPVERTKAEQESQYSGVFYIIQEHENPGNVLTFGIERGGRSALKERWERSGRSFDVVRMYQFEPESVQMFEHAKKTYTSPYYENEKVRLAKNVFEVTFVLDQALIRIT